MKKKLAAALSGAALLLALSGCSDDSNEKLDAWAKTVCDQVSAQTKKINAANTAITQVNGSAEPADVKKADSAAFQQISDAYKALADSVDEAGAPNFDNGAQHQKDSVTALTGTAVAYAGVTQQVNALGTSDQAKFADGLTTVSAAAKSANKTAETALDTLSAGEAGKAMATQPGCQKAGSSAGGSAAPSVSASASASAS